MAKQGFKILDCDMHVMEVAYVGAGHAARRPVRTFPGFPLKACGNDGLGIQALRLHVCRGRNEKKESRCCYRLSPERCLRSSS
jgi:hypothetical protein